MKRCRSSVEASSSTKPPNASANLTFRGVRNAAPRSRHSCHSSAVMCAFMSGTMCCSSSLRCASTSADSSLRTPIILGQLGIGRGRPPRRDGCDLRDRLGDGGVFLLHPRQVLHAQRKPCPQRRPQLIVLGRMMVVQHREDVAEMSGYHLGPLGVAGHDAANQIRSVCQFATEHPVDERHLERVGRHRRLPSPVDQNNLPVSHRLAAHAGYSAMANALQLRRDPVADRRR